MLITNGELFLYPGEFIGCVIVMIIVILFLEWLIVKIMSGIVNFSNKFDSSKESEKEKGKVDDEAEE
jgi:Na+-transporting methylmalonyl-CoA/oxaloacetate decarboxylase gamma subunit